MGRFGETRFLLDSGQLVPLAAKRETRREETQRTTREQPLDEVNAEPLVDHALLLDAPGSMAFSRKLETAAEPVADERPPAARQPIGQRGEHDASESVLVEEVVYGRNVGGRGCQNTEGQFQGFH